MGRCWERRGKCRPTARRDSYLKKNRCLGVRQPGLQQSSPETVSLQRRKKPAAQIPGPLSTLKKTLLASTLCTYRRYTAGKPRCDGCTTLFLRICCKINQPTPAPLPHKICTARKEVNCLHLDPHECCCSVLRGS